jgi:hypothetical protein
MITSRLHRLATKISGRDWLAALALVLLAVWLFRGHVFAKDLWIGNPDRLNSDLKVLQHYLMGLQSGHINAWNEHEMMGYDSFALPYTYPNPLTYLLGLIDGDRSYVTMGYVGVALLAAAGLAAYSFIRTDLPTGMPAFVGAVCYEFSSLTLLKVSQNSMSFAVFIMIPLLALVIRRIRRDSAPSCLVALSILLAGMLSLMFLQKVAYALMLCGGYALWQTLAQRSWRPALIFAAAGLLAVAFSWPRLLGVASAMGQYVRTIDGLDFRNFDTLYEFQNIRPSEILRWFDYGIFGRSPSESQLLGNNINLTEGFLLHTSAIAPLLLVTGLVRHRLQWLKMQPSRQDAGFFFWVLIACIAVIVWKPAAHALYLLFLKVDFTHARILIAALLPLSILLAFGLQELSARGESAGSNWLHGPTGCLAGFGAAWGIDAIAGEFPGSSKHFDLPVMRNESLIRVGLSAVLYLLLLWTILKPFGRPAWGRIAPMAIGSLLAGQCLLAANEQVNGPLAFDFLRPFRYGDYYHARRDEFHSPTKEQLRTLHARIEPERYRVALVCDRNIADGFCAGHVPEFWQLRAIDGYYGLGVPARLRALPWPTGPSLRTISFGDVKEIPWDLLGLLNVRWLLVAGDGLFRNIVRDGERIVSKADPAAFEVVTSPARVTPRAFFTAGVEPVASAGDAVKGLFGSQGIADPQKMSFVEGWAGRRHFDVGGDISLTSGPDLLELRFAPSSGERFLVLNELYYPGWRAHTDGRELPVLPVNAVMRGVAVPPGSALVTFRYTSKSESSWASLCRVAAILGLLAVWFALRRAARR